MVGERRCPYTLNSTLINNMRTITKLEDRMKLAVKLVKEGKRINRACMMAKVSKPYLLNYLAQLSVSSQDCPKLSQPSLPN
jgi:hypothetical protein